VQSLSIRIQHHWTNSPTLCSIITHKLNPPIHEIAGYVEIAFQRIVSNITTSPNPLRQKTKPTIHRFPEKRCPPNRPSTRNPSSTTGKHSPRIRRVCWPRTRPRPRGTRAPPGAASRASATPRRGTRGTPRPRPPPTSPETGGERSGTAGRGGRRRLRSGECAVQERFGAGSWHGRGVGIPSGRDDGYGGFRLTLKSQPPVQMACKYILHPNMYVKRLQQLV
jgi:hypothetical protein